MAEKLKPCPACEGTDIKYSMIVGRTDADNKYYYYCGICGYKTAIKATVELADKAWNRRTKDGTE